MSYGDHYKDPDRPDYLVEIEVENRACHNLLLPCVCNAAGHNVSNPGVQRFKVYESELAKIMELVEEDPELIAAAEKVYRIRLLAKMQKEELIEPKAKWESVDWKKPEIETFMSGCTASVQSVFTDQNQRELKPLVRCTVLQTGLLQEAPSDPMEKYRTAPAAAPVDQGLLEKAMSIFKAMQST